MSSNSQISVGIDKTRIKFHCSTQGFSNHFHPGKKLLTSCGSLAYSAPEILLGDPYDAPAVGRFAYIFLSTIVHRFHSDIWSLGVILFMLVTGRAPFQEANDSETVMMILDCSYKLPPNVSVECQQYERSISIIFIDQFSFS